MRFGHIFTGGLCYNCVYNISNKNDPTLEKGMCSKFNRYADLCRFDETKCGMGGKYFKEKSKNPFQTGQTIQPLSSLE
jgi:hypothetical protein